METVLTRRQRTAAVFIAIEQIDHHGDGFSLELAHSSENARVQGIGAAVNCVNRGLKLSQLLL